MLIISRGNVQNFIDARAFRDWLKLQPPGQTVGISDDEDGCPFSNYVGCRITGLSLDEYLYGLPRALNVTVNCDDIGVSTNDEYETFTTEDWIKDFMREVDGIVDGEEHIPDYIPISAGRALEIIEEVIAKWQL